MMSELFDEQAQREAYNEARDQEMLNEGELKGKEAVAANLLALGDMAHEKIAAVTGLSLVRIDEIANKMKPISA